MIWIVRDVRGEKMDKKESKARQALKPNSYKFGSRSVGGETGSRILKLSADGKVEWRREFGIGDHRKILSIKSTPDGCIAAVGNTWFKKDGQGFWIMKKRQTMPCIR